MTETHNELVAFWQSFQPAEWPFAHPDDLPVLRPDGGKYIHGKLNFDEFVTGPYFEDYKDYRLHLSLYPAPYMGDLAAAEIVVAWFHPGFIASDYLMEEQPEFRRRLMSNLRQDFKKEVEFPFFPLDPKLCLWGGYGWWHSKLNKTIRVIADECFNGRYRDAAGDLSPRLAAIQLVPYHSVTFRKSLIEDLESAKMARKFVHDVLIPAAREGTKTIIIVSPVEIWGVEGSDNIVVYPRVRNVTLGPDTRGGEAILKRYGLRRT
jgi:hypothetical protein